MSDPLNPLLVDVILHNIYRKLDLKDLLTCRLVCHKWNALGTSIVQPHGPRIFFEEQEEWNKILPIITELDGGGLVVGESQFVLCDKLILQIEETYAEYEDLIEKCAPTLKFLEVIGGPERRPSKGTETLRNWMTRMPELETLKINCPGLYGVTELFGPGSSSAQLDSLQEFSLRKIGGRGHLSQTFFDDFFSKCQNLKRLSFDVNKETNNSIFDGLSISFGYDDSSDEDEHEDDPYSRPSANQNLDVILKALEDKSNLDKLKSMKFSGLATSHLNALLSLSRIGLNLNSFELTDDWMDRRRVLQLLEFISVQKASLTKLVLSPSCIIGELYRTGYRELLNGMVALEELVFFAKKNLNFNRLGLVHYYSPNEAPHPPSFCFPEMFPNLTKLSLRGSNMSDFIDDFFAEGFEIIPCKTLRQLRLPQGKLTAEETVAEKFSQLFPDITSLDVRRPSNEFLHGIWKFWPELTDLKVLGVASRRGHCLDHGFTGIAKNICTEMEFCGWNSDIRGADIVNQFKIKPSITDLKKLKRLNLHFESGESRFRAKLVSDMFIHTALMEMSQLEEVFITESILNAVSESSVHNQTSDLSLEAVQNLRARLTSTKIQVRSNRVRPNRRNPIFHPDFDKKPYTVLKASSFCGRGTVHFM